MARDAVVEDVGANVMDCLSTTNRGVCVVVCVWSCVPVVRTKSGVSNTRSDEWNLHSRVSSSCSCSELAGVVVVVGGVGVTMQPSLVHTVSPHSVRATSCTSVNCSDTPSGLEMVTVTTNGSFPARWVGVAMITFGLGRLEARTLSSSATYRSSKVQPLPLALTLTLPLTLTLRSWEAANSAVRDSFRSFQTESKPGTMAAS
mmetsp:Transcript_54759/g.65877  ORF Transcript_54759/g.65877 Transcript_54759/m.65877 type:complete len:202 (-) Transcript_54759:2102-2707(-)